MTAGCSSAVPQQHNSRYVTLRNVVGQSTPIHRAGILVPKNAGTLEKRNVMSKGILFLLITLVITMVADGQQSSLPSPSRIDLFSALEPGTYTITGHVSEEKRAGQAADCSAIFRVKSLPQGGSVPSPSPWQ